MDHQYILYFHIASQDSLIISDSILLLKTKFRQKYCYLFARTCRSNRQQFSILIFTFWWCFVPFSLIFSTFKPPETLLLISQQMLDGSHTPKRSTLPQVNSSVCGDIVLPDPGIRHDTAAIISRNL